MGAYLSTRATLCLLAGIGALVGGVAGAAIVGKLATDSQVDAAVARDEPAGAPSSRATQVAAAAAQSPSRQPTPWSAADAQAARAAGERHRAIRRHASSRVTVSAPRASADRGSAPASKHATPVTRLKTPAGGGGASGTPPARVSPTPQSSTPVQSPVQRPARAPEPAPKGTRPSPEAAPAHTPPKPDPTGAFDDSG